MFSSHKKKIEAKNLWQVVDKSYFCFEIEKISVELQIIVIMSFGPSD